MDRTSGYLSQYLFEWDFLDIVVGGRSPLDSKFFVSHMYNRKQVGDFLLGYGFDLGDPINRAELFGNFQEALQFIKRYFLKEGNPEGLDFAIPASLYKVTEVEELFLIATGCHGVSGGDEERLWAELVLKVMHTILHVDKDLRTAYFKVIQTQILDRFYKYLFREDERLFIGQKGESAIEIIDFEAKSQKTRDSIILKLLHKAENVAEELFDRIGIRIVTKSKFDALRIIKFYLEKNILIPHNVKPSRTKNTMINLGGFRRHYQSIVKESLRKNASEEEFLSSVQTYIDGMEGEWIGEGNKHSSEQYRSIHFTSRQLISYRNPFFKEFSELKRMAKEQNGEGALAKKILEMDVSLIARNIRFFYPYEVQIVDEKSHRNNTQGEASHFEYKKNQIQASIKRLFRHLIDLKGIEI